MDSLDGSLKWFRVAGSVVSADGASEVDEQDVSSEVGWRAVLQSGDLIEQPYDLSVDSALGTQLKVGYRFAHNIGSFWLNDK